MCCINKNAIRGFIVIKRENVRISVDKKDYDPLVDYYDARNNTIARIDHSSKRSWARELSKTPIVPTILIVSIIIIGLMINILIKESNNEIFLEDRYFKVVWLFVLSPLGAIFLTLFSLVLYINDLCFNAHKITEISSDQYNMVKKYTPENLELLHTAFNEKEIQSETTHDAIDNAINAIIQNAQNIKDESNRVKKPKEITIEEKTEENNVYDTINSSWNDVTKKIVEKNKFNYA